MSDIMHTETYTDLQTNTEYKVTYWYDSYYGAPDTEFDGHGRFLFLDYDPTDPTEIDERAEDLSDDFVMRAPLMRKVLDGHCKTTSAGHKIGGLWYDFVASLNIATNEWGVSPENAMKAVEQDFKYIYGWYNDEWYWIGITIQRADEDDPWHDTTHTVGGFESLILDDEKAKDEVLAEMVFELESQIHHETHKDQLSLPLV